MDATITVSRVEKRPTSRGDVFRIYDEQDRDFATFDTNLALHAQSLVGKRAIVAFNERQNGQYVNRYLNAIAESDVAVNAESIPADGKQERIERQSAVKAAIETLPHLKPDEVTSASVFLIADAYARYYRTGEKPEVTQAAVGQQSFDSDIPF